MNKKLKLILIMLATFILLAACNNEVDDQTSEEEVPETEDFEGSENLDVLEPDLEGIPDVVAEVNGVEITGEKFELTYVSQFQQAAQQAQMSGAVMDQDLDRHAIAENMIDLELLIQEAEARNFEATDQEVEELLVEISDANQLESVDQLLELYEEQGITEVQLREEIATEIKLNQILEDETSGLTVSDEQVEEFYEEFLALYEEMDDIEGEDLPSMEEMRPELEDQILLNEENQLILDLIEQLKNDGEVVNYM